MQPTESYHKDLNEIRNQQVSDFIGCLTKIDSRISSIKEESQIPRYEPISAHIDKLKVVFQSPVEKEVVIEQMQVQNFDCKTSFLNGRQPFLELRRGSSVFYMRSKPFIDSFTSNPSKFQSWCEFKTDANSVCSIFEGSHKISRLDLALNYSGNFNDLKNHLRVTRVGSKNDFTVENYESSKNTGVRYGKKPRQVELYDYSLKHSTSDKTVRLEERLFHKKVPLKDLCDLPQILDQEIFKGVSLEHSYLPSTLANLNDKTSLLKNLISSIGYMETRKNLNADGNFNRDYGKYLISEPYLETPQQSFKRLIQKFFTT